MTSPSPVDGLAYAYQPIVNVHTGEAYGFEALLRGVERHHGASIPEYFAAIDERGLTLETELALLHLAVRAFTRFADATPARLFFNLNNHVLDVSPDHPERIREILRCYALPFANFCIEISESAGLSVAHAQALASWRHRPLIAVDDFGTGYSGLRLLAETRPDIVKIDRFFVADVDRTQGKREFLAQIVGLAHATGLLVIAEGVETEGEFSVCRDVGCDYVQGYFIARPSLETAALPMHYPLVEEINRRNRHSRREQRASDELRAQLDTVPALKITSKMEAILDAFRGDQTRSFFPIVNTRGEPLGIVHEERLKALIYSQFGRDLLTNRVQPHRVQDYLTPCLTFDVSTGIDRILSAIAQRPTEHAVLIADGGRYIGLLDTRGMIRTMHERMLAMARDENPLTRLPGNVMVANYMAEAIESDQRPLAVAHFDFDYFKPFNDRFGFRVGDRAISMFAELMRSRLSAPDTFLGHIGGDDFFLGVSGPNTDAVIAEIPAFLEQFRSDVESFYDPQTRRVGLVEVTERSGAKRMVSLLSVSCACVIVPPGAADATLDGVSAMLARLKHTAKQSDTKFALEIVGAEVPA